MLHFIRRSISLTPGRNFLQAVWIVGLHFEDTKEGVQLPEPTIYCLILSIWFEEDKEIHMWNIAKIYEKEYCLEITFHIIVRRDRHICYCYFLVRDMEMLLGITKKRNIPSVPWGPTPSNVCLNQNNNRKLYEVDNSEWEESYKAGKSAWKQALFQWEQANFLIRTEKKRGTYPEECFRWSMWN